MEERVNVEEKHLREVYKELKAEGLSLRKISEEIKSDFRNHLYKQSSFPREVFERLETLYARQIPHKVIAYVDGRGEVEDIVIEKDPQTAEFVGMMLGDGHIDEHSYYRGDRYISSHYMSVTLNTGEKKIIDRAKYLAERCLDKNFSHEKLSHANAVNLKIHGKEVLKALFELGLESGNKVEKQIEVPGWIFTTKENQKSCLKGLVNTDGSCYTRSQDGYKVIYFKNKSDPLLDGFSKMCEALGIRTSRAGRDAVQIASQKHVETFMRVVEPLKSFD